MTGTIIRYRPKRGKPTFGYSVDLGRKPDGKRNRVVKRGFSKESEAQDALRKAIEEHERKPAAERTAPTFGTFSSDGTGNALLESAHRKQPNATTNLESIDPALRRRRP